MKQILQEEFDLGLVNFLNEEYGKNAAKLLYVAGVYEILSEEFNNEVIDYILENRGK